MPRKEAAIRALHVIEHLGGKAEEFRSKWLSMQAFSSEFERGNQRHSLIAAIEAGLSNTVACNIIAKLEDEIEYLTKYPVGNLEYEEADQNFYQNALQDIRQAGLSTREYSNRLGHVICVVYQVRCNIEHGRKKLGTQRSQKLFHVCNKILDLVMSALLEEAEAA